MKRWTIHKATERGKIEVLAQLLDSDPSLVNARTPSGDQPLHLAAWQDQVAAAVALLDRGADINSKGDQGRTPLHYAAMHSSPKVADVLIAHGADVNLADESGHTPLYWTAMKRTPDGSRVFGMLLQAGAELNLPVAVALKMKNVVRGILLSDPDALRKSSFASELLLTAVQSQDRIIVDTLLEHGADPNHYGGAFAPEPPLLSAVAAQTNDFLIVKTLVSHGADVNIQDSATQESPLQRAKAVGFTQAVDYLLANGANG